MPGRNSLLLLILLIMSFYYVCGQPGIAEMQQVRQDLKNSFFSAWDTSLVLSAIFGIIGGLRVYHNLQMGRDRFTAEVTGWFLAAIFMVLIGPFLQKLMGI
jgi:succinate dehydrogenase hydrophobic anchor subunit